MTLKCIVSCFKAGFGNPGFTDVLVESLYEDSRFELCEEDKIWADRTSIMSKFFSILANLGQTAVSSISPITKRYTNVRRSGDGPFSKAMDYILQNAVKSYVGGLEDFKDEELILIICHSSILHEIKRQYGRIPENWLAIHVTNDVLPQDNVVYTEFPGLDSYIVPTEKSKETLLEYVDNDPSRIYVAAVTVGPEVGESRHEKYKKRINVLESEEKRRIGIIPYGNGVDPRIIWSLMKDSKDYILNDKLDVVLLGTHYPTVVATAMAYATLNGISAEIADEYDPEQHHGLIIVRSENIETMRKQRDRILEETDAIVGFPNQTVLSTRIASTALLMLTHYSNEEPHCKGLNEVYNGEFAVENGYGRFVSPDEAISYIMEHPDEIIEMCEASYESLPSPYTGVQEAIDFIAERAEERGLL